MNKNINKTNEEPYGCINIDELIMNIIEKLVNYIIDNNMIDYFMEITDSQLNAIGTQYFSNSFYQHSMVLISCGCYYKYINYRYKYLFQRYDEEYFYNIRRNLGRFEEITLDKLEDHWKNLKFWNINNILSVFDCKRRMEIDKKNYNLRESNTNYVNILMKNIEANIKFIKMGVYNTLKYKKRLLGEIPDDFDIDISV